MTETAPQKTKYIIALSVAVVTLFVYLPSLRNDFVGVWDDNSYIVENPYIRSLDRTFFQWAILNFHVSNWHPLTWVSHALDYAIWGLNPLGHHLTSITLHAINTALVVLLALKLLEIVREKSEEKRSVSFLNDRTILIAAGVTGLLFGIHPVHVESVAWVSERKDLLCALFFLLSIMMYVKAVERTGHGVEGRRLRLSALLPALCFFLLALLSKPMAVSLPVVLLILDWYPFNRIRSFRTFWTAAAEKIPFLVLSSASSIITILAQNAGESVASLELMPLSSRILVAVRSIVAYLEKMLLPLNLASFYPYPKNVSLFSLEYLSAIFFLIGISGICLVFAKERKLWLTLLGYYVITLIPVLGIVQVGNQAMADRYMYLPSIGPFLAVGVFVAWIAEKVKMLPGSGMIHKFIFMVMGISLFFALSYITFKQTGIWENGYTLWNHAIVKGYESSTAYNNRGVSLDELGQRNKAIGDLNRAIALDPRNYFAYNNIGVILGKEGQYQKSIEYFLNAIAINPNADSYCNLGLSYFYVNQYGNALENYNKAIRLKQDFDVAYLDRGNLYFTMGNRGLAMADYQKSCSLGNKRACEILNLVPPE